MKVLALASYPIQAAATRYRLHQFVEPLKHHNIELDIRPFFDSRVYGSLYKRNALPATMFGVVKSGLLRVRDVAAARKTDVLLIQREAMILGPPVVEWLSMRWGRCPMVLDLDDATYLPYVSPVYGRLGSALKWFRKTDDLIRWASLITCGNQTIASYVENKGKESRLIPTVVDTEIFRPVVNKRRKDVPVIGWIGTHSTFPYLKTILPTLQELAKTHAFKLKIIGAGRQTVDVKGVEVESLDWQLEREVEDFQSFDIGLYPIDVSLHNELWAAGKSGFKAIQYMAVGIPYVASPVGAVNDVGKAGTTNFVAQTSDEWFGALALLLSNPALREEMGAAGRRHSVECFSLPHQAAKMARALSDAASGKTRGVAR